MPFVNDCEDYLEEITRIHKSGNATEPSYYSAIKDLVQTFVNQLNLISQVIVAPKKTKNGMPDLLMKRDITLLGYIEAKDIAIQLSNIEKSDQITRYLEAFPNLILTDFFTFWLYRNGKKIFSATLADKNRLLTNATIPRVTGLNEIQNLLSLFCSFSPIPSVNAKQLATQLAIRAKQLSIIIFDEILGKNQILEQIYNLLKDNLLSSLTPHTFSDVYSQTLAYGLFAAKIEADNKIFERVNAYSYLSTNIPLLQRLFYIMQDPSITDSVKWILDDIVGILNISDIKSILSDFHTKTWSEDPMVHFYETFLSVYNPKLREKRGVYYTPAPVVAYIIKSIQQILVKEFARVDGLADSHVLLLDPAAGSLTFLVLAIRLVKDLCAQQGKSGIFPSLVREHILKNYFGFELLLAPYVIGHLKAKLTLKDLQYQTGLNDRFQLYLTNALEPGIPRGQQSLFPELLIEAANASRVKAQDPIVVICGNPPYSSSSDNKSDFIESLMEDYKRDVRNEKNLQPLSNDYIKFLRFAQWKIAEKTHNGIVGMITDNSYLDGLIHRGMRKKLLDAFNQVIIINLHGNSRSITQRPKGQKDENVFEIQQGVAIVFLIKNNGARKVLYADLWGSKEEKYHWLLNNDLYSTKWESLDPKSPFFWLFPKHDKIEYQDFPSLDQIMPFHQQGIKTHRDWLVVGYEDAEIKSRIEYIRSHTKDEILAACNLRKSQSSSISLAIKKVQSLPTLRNNALVDYLYRPFDNRRLYYDRILIDRSRPFLAKQRGTIFLITRRSSRQWTINWTFAFVTKNLPDIDMRGGVYAFPINVDGSPNYSSKFLDIISKFFVHSFNPLDILGYIYAILYCNEYRKEYSEDLRLNFPRIPITADQDLFTETSNIGKNLVQVHLLEDPKLDNLEAGFPEVGTDILEKLKYVNSQARIYINEDQYFSNISLEIWNYEIGGYQICHRWLQERLGRRLGLSEQTTFMHIVGAIRKTIDLQQQIDLIYPAIKSRTLRISLSNNNYNETLI